MWLFVTVTEMFAIVALSERDRTLEEHNQEVKDLNTVKILFFVPHENIRTSGVFASQVLGLARYCVSLGAECLVFHFAPEEKESCIEIEPHVQLLNSTKNAKGSNVFTVVGTVKNIAEKYRPYFLRFSPTHVYTRNYAMCLGVLPFVKEIGAKLIYSMRGPDVYERTRSGKIRDYIAGFFIERLVRKAVKYCDVFTSMSQGAIDWVSQKYGKEGIAFPCCVTNSFFRNPGNFDRSLARKKLGFEDCHKVIVWSGNLAYWQRLGDIVQLVKGMCDLDVNIRILFITREKADVKSLCESNMFHERFYKIISAKPNEVPDYLRACDVGLDCLAVDDFKSAICCPIKVGEYLAIGLPILITRTMGDIPDIVRENNVGAILDDGLDPTDAIDKLNAILKLNSAKIRKVAYDCFSWNSHRRAVLQLFA